MAEKEGRSLNILLGATRDRPILTLAVASGAGLIVGIYAGFWLSDSRRAVPRTKVTALSCLLQEETNFNGKRSESDRHYVDRNVCCAQHILLSVV